MKSCVSCFQSIEETILPLQSSQPTETQSRVDEEHKKGLKYSKATASDSDNAEKRSKSADREERSSSSRKSRHNSKKHKRKRHPLRSLGDTMSSVVSSELSSNRYRRMSDEGSPDEERERSRQQSPSRTTQLQEEVKQMNITSSSGDEVVARVTAVEERLRSLEESTQMSLYNIEALLRNFIFYQNSGRAVPFAGDIHRYRSEYGQQFQDDLL